MSDDKKKTCLTCGSRDVYEGEVRCPWCGEMAFVAPKEPNRRNLDLRVAAEVAMRMLDLVGKRFGRLKVMSRVENYGEKVRWECLCKCGNTTIVRTHSLREGTTRSCGCLKSDTPHSGGRGKSKNVGPANGRWIDGRSLRGRRAFDLSRGEKGGRG